MTETNGGPQTIALVALEAKRVDDLRAQAERRIDERDKLREEHRKELAMAEAKRLDAERDAEKERVDAVIAADRAAVLLANTEAKAVAAALVVQVETTRKATDAQVESSATALRASNEATTKALVGRIEPLEAARYQQVGVKEQRTEGKQDNRWLIGLGMSLPAWALAVITLVILLTQ